MSLHFREQTLKEAVLYSSVRKDAGGDSHIDVEVLSSIAQVLLAVDLPDVNFPRTPFEIFGRNQRSEKVSALIPKQSATLFPEQAAAVQSMFNASPRFYDQEEIWRKWRELSTEKRSVLRDEFITDCQRELDQLKGSFSMVQGDRFIGPLLALCTSQLGKRKPVPGIWKNIEGLELIQYIAVETQDDIQTLRNAISKALDHVKAAANKGGELPDFMFQEMALTSKLDPLRQQRDILALATLSSPPSPFFEKFNSVDIDREQRAVLDPVWAKLDAEVCADFCLSKEELRAKRGFFAPSSESCGDTYWRCFDEWQATPETRVDGALIARLVRMGTDEAALRHYGAALATFRDAEALLERSLLALLPQLDRLSPAQAKWLVYHAYRSRSISPTSNGAPSARSRGPEGLRGEFRDPAFLPAELNDGVLAALLDLLSEADCVSRGECAGDAPRMLAARRLARAAHESPRHRARIAAGFSRALRTVAGRDVRAESRCDFMDRVEVAGLIDLVCDMQARDDGVDRGTRSNGPSSALACLVRMGSSSCGRNALARADGRARWPRADGQHERRLCRSIAFGFGLDFHIAPLNPLVWSEKKAPSLSLSFPSPPSLSSLSFLPYLTPLPALPPPRPPPNPAPPSLFGYLVPMPALCLGARPQSPRSDVRPVPFRYPEALKTLPPLPNIQARECIADVSALLSGPGAALVNLSCSRFSGAAGQRLGLGDFLHHMGVGTVSKRHREAAAACFGVQIQNVNGPDGACTRGGGGGGLLSCASCVSQEAMYCTHGQPPFSLSPMSRPICLGVLSCASRPISGLLPPSTHLSVLLCQRSADSFPSEERGRRISRVPLSSDLFSLL